jgi:nitrous oxidase accessory protein NosD
LGCTIANNPSHGILIDGAFATNTRVIGGNISQNTTGVYCNINATKFCIQGVKIGASGEFTANTTGITLAGGNDDFVISDNEITGNTTQINLASYGHHALGKARRAYCASEICAAAVHSCRHRIMKDDAVTRAKG